MSPKDFAGTTLHKRGDDYEEFKKTLGDDLVEFACKLYPQIRHHIDYVEVATPMTNNYYLGQGRNSIHAKMPTSLQTEWLGEINGID